MTAAICAGVCLAAFALLWSTSSVAAQTAPVRYRDLVFQGVDRTANLTYGQATDIPSGQPVSLRLDLYEPRGDTEPARPVLLFIHGGGFTAGDKSTGGRWANEFVKRGWVVVSIGYRLNQGNLYSVGIPAAVSDARQAMRWLRQESATHRLDTDRIVVGGSSAGAITALFLAYTDVEKGPEDEDSAVAGVMDLWGALFGLENAIEAGGPPLIIVHGTEDTVVPYENAVALRDQAKAVGLPYAFHPLEGVGHGSGQTALISSWTADFFYPLLWPGSDATQTHTPIRTPTETPSEPPTMPPTTSGPTVFLPLVIRGSGAPGAPVPTALPTQTTKTPGSATTVPTAEATSTTVPATTAPPSPTSVANTINGCAADSVDLCAYRPPTWHAVSAVRTVQGLTVTNTADGRDLPMIVRFAAPVSGQRPVVVWSHGGGPRDDVSVGMNRQWATILARAGYVVVQPAHVPPNTAALCAKLGVTDPAACRSINAMTWYRPTDARAVLDALPQLLGSVPALVGTVDYSRVAYAGHSFGAFTSMTVAGARVDYAAGHMDVDWGHSLPSAFLALSPQGPHRFGFHGDSWREIHMPVLTASGAGDTTGAAPLGEQAEDRREPFRRMPDGDKHELWVDDPDAVHGTFNLSDAGPGQRYHGAIAMAGVAFLDAYVLRHEPAEAWLASNNVVVLGVGDVEWLAK